MFRRFSLCAVITLSLAACAAPRQEVMQAAAAPPPAPPAIIDPDNGQLANAIKGYVSTRGGPQHSQYEFTRIDLDDDGRREGLVIMTMPYVTWCGKHGCRMAVFKAHNNGFTLLSEIEPVRGPMKVSEKRTNGWRDLIVLIDGRRELPRKEVALRHDGRGYPQQPEDLPAVMASNTAGVRIFP